MTLPSIVGVAVANAGTGGTANADFTSTGRVAGDFLILISSTPNRPVTTPSGWTAFSTSGQSSGTAGGTNAIRLSAYWKISDGTETTVNAASSSGNHAVITGIVLRGQDPTTPINVTTGGIVSSTTAITFTPVTTTANDCLVLNLLASSLDFTGSNNMSSVANASLANLTVQYDHSVNTDVGGGAGIITGELATAGASGSTTATYVGSANYGVITVAIAGISGGDTTIATLSASPGAFSLAGQPSAFSSVIGASPAAFGITGQVAKLAQGIAANPGTFAISGKPATFALGSGFLLSASPGSFAILGQPAQFSVGLAAQPGLFNITGQPATFTQGSAAPTLAADPGSFIITGEAASFVFNSAPRYSPYAPFSETTYTVLTYRTVAYQPYEP